MSEKTELEPCRTKTRSAVVLAGGRGRRMGMAEKTLLEFDGKTILEFLISSLSQAVDEIVVSVRDYSQETRLMHVIEKFPACEIRFSYDSTEGTGPLEGIRAGLLEISSEYAFVCAGDMPFINSSVVDLLFENAEGHDAVVPKHKNGKFEPLHAVYSKRLIPKIEKALEKGKYSVLTPVFELQDVVFVEVFEILKLDPELRTFMNINTVEDLKQIAGHLAKKNT